MVGITQNSDGRWRRVGDPRGIEPFGELCCAVARLSRGRLSAQLTFVTFLGQFRIQFGSYQWGKRCSFDFPVVSKQQRQVSRGEGFGTVPDDYAEIATYFVELSKSASRDQSCPRARRYLVCLLVCLLRNLVTGSSERLPDSQLGFVQLRLRVAHGAIQELCDLLMLIAFDFVQQENCPVPPR